MGKTSCLQAELQQAPAALDRHLQGMAEKLRSGENGKVREAIEQPIARILVGGDGSLSTEAKPGGLLGLDGSLSHGKGPEGRALMEMCALSAGRRQWKLITAR